MSVATKKNLFNWAKHIIFYFLVIFKFLLGNLKVNAFKPYKIRLDLFEFVYKSFYVRRYYAT